MNPEIELIDSVTVVGLRTMLKADDGEGTFKLWREFGPRRAEVEHVIGKSAYNVTRYLGMGSPKPDSMVERWAALPVRSFHKLPEGMMALDIPGGLYARFTYTGVAADFPKALAQFHTEWLPQSGFRLDSRPYFETLGPAYLGVDNPESQEKVYIPVVQ